MKRIIYISAFSFLGFLVQVLLHALIEIAYINLLEIDFAIYSLGLTWQQLLTIHHTWAVLLALLGLGFGYVQGKYWWQVIDVEKKS